MTKALACDLVVTRLDRVADVVVAQLERPDGDAIPHTWRAGAHIDLVADPETGLVRQYSLCGDPQDSHRWRIAVRRTAESRGGSAWLHERLEVGSIVRASAPRNNFQLDAADGYVFVAGGIGITPILPMIAEAESNGAEWTLIYAGRSIASMPFASELVARYPDQVQLFSSAASGRVDLATELAVRRENVLVYSCGPDSMLDEIAGLSASWPSGCLRMERFSANSRGGIDADMDRPFTAELALSGIVVEVAADQTLLDAVEKAGVLTLSSCREGTCGTCEIVVRAGDVDHRDVILTPEEREAGETMMICVSRSLADSLTLEL